MKIAEIKILRRMCGVNIMNKIRNECIKDRLRWFGCIGKRNNDNVVKEISEIREEGN